MTIELNQDEKDILIKDFELNIQANVRIKEHYFENHQEFKDTVEYKNEIKRIEDENTLFNKLIQELKYGTDNKTI